jgi:hypothetical protein
MMPAASATPAIKETGIGNGARSDGEIAQGSANGHAPSFESTQPPADVHAEISKLAYSLWCQRGCPDGSPEVDWLAAEQKLREASFAATLPVCVQKVHALVSDSGEDLDVSAVDRATALHRI